MTAAQFIASKSADRAVILIAHAATRREYGLDAEALTQIERLDHRKAVRRAAARALKALKATQEPTQ